MFELISASRDKFRALVDGLADAVMSIDTQYRIIAVNQALAQGLNRHPREIIGQPCHQLLYGLAKPCPDHGHLCPAARTRISRGLEIVEHQLPLGTPADAGNRFVEIRAMPVLAGPDEPDQGNPAEIIVVRRDVTPTRRAEIELKRYNERLELEVGQRTRELRLANEELNRQAESLAQTNDELLKLQSLKEDLTNMVVHDLKGPLAEIQANLEMLQAEPLSEFQGELLEAAKLGGYDLLRMVTNLLDVSRLEENRMVLDLEPFDVERLIEETITRFTPLAQLTGVRLTMELAENLPMIVADRRLFERILNNLVSNALDYTPEDGRITILANATKEGHRFEVADTGRGVPPEMRDRIFEKFSQGQKGRAKTSSGLGLTFCRMAIQAHGGQIWVESTPGQGSRFIFVFPLQATGRDSEDEA